MSTVEVLRAARARIDTPEKWGAGSYGDPDGPVCASGALYLAYGAEQPSGFTFADGRDLDALVGFTALCRAAHGQDPGPTLSRIMAPGEARITEWNDEATHEEVLAAFDTAIAHELAREQEFTVESVMVEEPAVA